MIVLVCILSAAVIFAGAMGFEYICRYGEKKGIVQRHKDDKDKPEQ